MYLKQTFALLWPRSISWAVASPYSPFCSVDWPEFLEIRTKLGPVLMIIWTNFNSYVSKNILCFQDSKTSKIVLEMN